MVVQKQEGNLPERFPTRPQQQAQGVEVEEEAEEGEAQEAIGVAATEERRDESDIDTSEDNTDQEYQYRQTYRL